MNLYIITGATRGLGKALAEMLSHNVDNEILTLSRAPDAHSGNCRNYYLELAHPGSIPAVFGRALKESSAERYDKIVLINNAGIVEPVAALADCEVGAMEANLQVNLVAPIVLMQQFIALTRAMSGKRLVINISSGAGKRPVAGWSLYCAAKAGIDMASRVAGLEAESNEPGLTVCSLAPGVVDTGMQAQIRAKSPSQFPDVERFRTMKEQGALRAPDDVAAAILKLESAWAFQNGGVHDLREMNAA